MWYIWDCDVLDTLGPLTSGLVCSKTKALRHDFPRWRPLQHSALFLLG